jgi:hypothetical protein
MKKSCFRPLKATKTHNLKNENNKKTKKEKKNKKKNSLKYEAIDPAINKKFHVIKVTDANQKQLD